MNDLINIHNLSKDYKGFKLKDISLNVSAGSVVGLIGSNGAGKTTTIKAMLGLIHPSGGEISLFGTPLNPSSKTASQLKERIGVVFDACSFPDNISVADAGSIMKNAYINWDKALFERFLKNFKLEPKKRIKELSRGMGMKLSLACAFSHHPDLLILDEATAGLDPLARDEMLDILREFMADESHGILISSHITSDLERLADYIVCIDEGRLIFSLEKDAITDLAGVAQCRDADFERIVESGFFAPGELHYSKHAYGISALVFDRTSFSRFFADITIERASIDEYMGLMLKGDIR